MQDARSHLLTTNRQSGRLPAKHHIHDGDITAKSPFTHPLICSKAHIPLICFAPFHTARRDGLGVNACGRSFLRLLVLADPPWAGGVAGRCRGKARESTSRREIHERSAPKMMMLLLSFLYAAKEGSRGALLPPRRSSMRATVAQLSCAICLCKLSPPPPPPPPNTTPLLFLEQETAASSCTPRSPRAGGARRLTFTSGRAPTPRAKTAALPPCLQHSSTTGAQGLL